MPDLRVLADDGTIHSFPDNTDTSVINGVLDRYHSHLAKAPVDASQLFATGSSGSEQPWSSVAIPNLSQYADRITRPVTDALQLTAQDVSPVASRSLLRRQPAQGSNAVPLRAGSRPTNLSAQNYGAQIDQAAKSAALGGLSAAMSGVAPPLGAALAASALWQNGPRQMVGTNNLPQRTAPIANSGPSSQQVASGSSHGDWVLTLRDYLTQAAMAPYVFYHRVLPAALFGQDAHEALIDALQKQYPSGTWDGNTTMNGDFGSNRIDLINLLKNPQWIYELKLAGQDEKARKQLAEYLDAVRGRYVAGDPNYVFKDGPVSADTKGYLGGYHYDYKPGKYPGVLGYTMKDREGKIQELGEYLWNEVKKGLSHPPGTMTPFGNLPPSTNPPVYPEEFIF